MYISRVKIKENLLGEHSRTSESLRFHLLNLDERVFIQTNLLNSLAMLAIGFHTLNPGLHSSAHSFNIICIYLFIHLFLLWILQRFLLGSLGLLN